MVLTYFLNDFEMVPVAPIITGIIIIIIIITKARPYLKLRVQTMTAVNLVEVWPASRSGGFTHEQRVDYRSHKGQQDERAQITAGLGNKDKSLYRRRKSNPIPHPQSVNLLWHSSPHNCI
jgi:hypothetical protein